MPAVFAIDSLLAVLTHFDTDKDLDERINLLFQVLDTDDSGELSYDELYIGLKKIKVQPMISLSREDWDVMTVKGELSDENDEVNKATFLTIMRRQLKFYVQRQMANAFEMVPPENTHASVVLSVLKLLMVGMNEIVDKAHAADSPSGNSSANTSFKKQLEPFQTRISDLEAKVDDLAAKVEDGMAKILEKLEGNAPPGEKPPAQKSTPRAKVARPQPLFVEGSPALEPPGASIATGAIGAFSQFAASFDRSGQNTTTGQKTDAGQTTQGLWTTSPEPDASPASRGWQTARPSFPAVLTEGGETVLTKETVKPRDPGIGAVSPPERRAESAEAKSPGQNGGVESPGQNEGAESPGQNGGGAPEGRGWSQLLQQSPRGLLGVGGFLKESFSGFLPEDMVGQAAVRLRGAAETALGSGSNFSSVFPPSPARGEGDGGGVSNQIRANSPLANQIKPNSPTAGNEGPAGRDENRSGPRNLDGSESLEPLTPLSLEPLDDDMDGAVFST